MPDYTHSRPLTLSPEQLAMFMELVHKGYTIRAIRKKMKKAGCPLPSHTPDAQLIALMREHRRDIVSAREAAAQDVLDFVGLTDKMTRVKRLATMAEAMEEEAFVNPKTAAEYRRFLEQIRGELEPLNITLALGDPFGDLLRELADLGESQPSAEGEDQGRAFSDPLSEAEGDMA